MENELGCRIKSAEFIETILIFIFLSNLHILTGRHWVILERKKYPTIATDLLLCNGSDYFPKQESRSRMGDARRPSL